MKSNISSNNRNLPTNQESANNLKNAAETAEKASLTERLKKIYKLQDTLPKLIEDASVPEQKMDDYYVKLEIVLKDKKSSEEKQPIDISQIFEKIGDEDAAGKVLITGVAGIGKTSFLNHVAYEWGKGKAFDDKFTHVFKLRLKSLLDKAVVSELNHYPKEEQLAAFIKLSIEQQQQEIQASKKIEETVEFGLDEIKAVDKSSTLLLLDGYNEIEHLLRGDHVSRKIIYKVFEYPNVVITSRPGAISSVMESKFERKIEAVGLSSEGIDKYIEQYFSKQSQWLSEEIDSLSKDNSHIEDMHSMLEYYEEQNKKNILASLEAVYDYNCQNNNNPKNIEGAKESIGKYYTGLKEQLTKLLETNHTFQDASVTPINLAIVCLMSIDKNILSEFKGDFNAARIYEGVVQWLETKYLVKFNKNEIFEESKSIEVSDLINNDSRFVNLSFQEYLIAHSLKNQLADESKEVAKKAAELIASHRNEQRYLMTLKFLAGIVTNESGNENSRLAPEELVTRFWEAATCNLKGMLEISAESKVVLLMHLLGQSRVDGKFDERIPNLAAIQKFIDSNIEEQGLNAWQDNIISSGYLSANIVDKVGTLVRSAGSASPQQYGEIKAAFNLVQKFINHQQVRENIGDKSEVFDIILEALKIESLGWQMKKFFIKKLSEASEGVKDKNLCEASSKVILSIKGDDLIESSYVSESLSDCYVQLVKNMSNQNLKISTLSGLIPLLKDEDNFYRYLAVSVIGKIVAADKELAQSALDGVIPLLNDKYSDYRSSAANAIGEIAAGGVVDKKLSQSALDVLIPLLKDEDPYIRSSAAGAIGKVATGGVKKLAQSALDGLIPLMQDEKSSVISSAADAIVNIAAGDKELAKSVIDGLVPLLKEEGEVRYSAADAIVKITAVDKELAKFALDGLVPLLKDKEDKEEDDYRDCRSLVAEKVGRIAEGKVGVDDKELAKFALDGLIPLLQSESRDFRGSAAGAIATIVAGGLDKELAKSTMDGLIPLLKDESLYVRSLVTEAIGKIAAGDKELAKSTLDVVIPLLEDVDMRNSTVSAIGDIVAGDKELAKSALDGLIPILKDEYAKSWTAFVMEDIAAGDKELAQFALDGVVPLLKEGESYIRSSAANAIGKIAAGLVDKELARSALDRLISLLQDEDTDCRSSVAEAIAKISVVNLELAPDFLKNDSKELRETLHKSLMAKLSDLSKLEVQDISNLVKIISVCDPKETDDKELINAIAKLLKSSTDDLANNEEGFRVLVKAINESCSELPKGEHSVLLLKQMCHKMFADGEIEPAEAKLIKKCIIEMNITTTFKLSERKVIFEGKEYVISTEGDSDQLQYIVDSVVEESKDKLAEQYKNHALLFKNSGSVLEEEAVDLKTFSILESEENVREGTINKIDDQVQDATVRLEHVETDIDVIQHAEVMLGGLASLGTDQF